MDKILLRNLMFYGYHGVYEAERELGQKFYLDIELAADLEKAGYSDDLMDTIDYTAVYREVKQITEQTKFQLLEALSQTIADRILAMDARIEAVTVRVRKPSAPMPGAMDFVQTEITRRRKA
ncbi:MAG: dihydroneopterin aldolase [Selenomonadales bacterium]|nr:dihydroneopterin aldolase [Selenomonadales bacterium]